MSEKKSINVVSKDVKIDTRDEDDINIAIVSRIENGNNNFESKINEKQFADPSSKLEEQKNVIDDDDATEVDSESEEEIDPDENKKKEDDESRTPLQRKFYYFFEEPRSMLAKAFLILSMFCVILTVVVICVESYPTILELHETMYYEIWFPIDLFVTTIFTIEYIGRLYPALSKRKFVCHPLNIIDILSILPFYLQFLEFFPNQAEIILRLLRVIRLLRILRIIRLAKYSVGLSITAKVIKRSMHQMFMISLYFLIVLFGSSALMYNLEHGEEFNPNEMRWYRVGENGQLEPSPFQSIIHGLWWSMVTLTTTGYGDVVPITAPGKIVAGITMICGIMVIALSTSIIGSNFISEWEEHRRIQFQLRQQKTNKEANDILKEFHGSKTKTIDVLRNQNKIMLETITEIQEKLSELNPQFHYKKCKSIQKKYDEAMKRIEELESRMDGDCP